MAWRGKDTDNNIPLPMLIRCDAIYKEEFNEIARKLCELGATAYDLGQAFGVSQRTIDGWMYRYDDFNAACKMGKVRADDRVERSLYHRAVGYDFEASKFFCSEGQVIEHPYVEHVPPDTKAAIHWLNNRRPETWRNRVDVSGPNGGPVQIAISADDAKL